MTLEQIDRMVRQANPIPDPSALDAVDAVDVSATRSARAGNTAVRRSRRGSRRGLAVAATAAAVVVVGALLVAQALPGPAPSTDPKKPVTTDDPSPSRRVGFIGLPPEGAKPSTPEAGELVASLGSHISADGNWGTGSLYVFADGRVIWTRREGRPLPEGANRSSTGFLEQRLTAEGVERVRTELLASGLFDGATSGKPHAPLPQIRVRIDDRLVSVVGASDSERRTLLVELGQRLRSLESWLPARSWADRTIRPYVPSRFAVYVSAAGARDQSTVLERLPASARSVLQAAGGVLVAEPRNMLPGSAYRFDLTTEQARALATALRHDRLEDPGFSRYQLAYSVRGLGLVVFTPYLPDGELDCACGS